MSESIKELQPVGSRINSLIRRSSEAFFEHPFIKAAKVDAESAKFVRCLIGFFLLRYEFI